MASAGTAQLETKFDTQNCQDGCDRSCTLTVRFLYENKCFCLREHTTQLHHVDLFCVWNLPLSHTRKNLMVGYYIILALCVYSRLLLRLGILNFAHVTDRWTAHEVLRHQLASVVFARTKQSLAVLCSRIVGGRELFDDRLRAVHGVVRDRACLSEL